MNARLPRLLLAAPASGTGKTTLAMGLLRALLDRGLRPAARKCGPDYLDPLFHREALGIPSGNLDCFLSSPGVACGLLAEAAGDADIAILEGVMGYYDGVGGTDQASSWHLASATGTPVILVARAKGACLSLAALLRGFAGFRDNSMIRGVIFNHCDASLYGRLAPMVERETGLRCYGYAPEMPAIAIASRHLGLIPPQALPEMQERIALLAKTLRGTVDIDGLLEAANAASPLDGAPVRPPRRDGTPVRIAVARDRAFFFSYRENLDMLAAMGAEPVYFSPLDDATIPNNVHGLLLEGGYPEMHAAPLSKNTAMRQSIREAILNGMPTVAECGGFLYLHETLADPDGGDHPMVGIIPGRAANSGRLARFGYATVTAERDTLLLPAGTTARVHEFHYWDSDSPGDACTARKAGGDASWRCIHGTPTLHAGFPHLYFPGDSALPARFVDACVRYRDGRKTP